MASKENPAKTTRQSSAGSSAQVGLASVEDAEVKEQRRRGLAVVERVDQRYHLKKGAFGTKLVVKSEAFKGKWRRWFRPCRARRSRTSLRRGMRD